MELNTIVSEVGTLVDIRDVSVNKELSRDERIAEFVQQIKNPYHFKCGRFTVQASFSAEGATLEECIKGCLLYTSPSLRDKRQSRMPSSA